MALGRWQRREFLDLERQFARTWRAGLVEPRLEETYRLYRGMFRGKRRPKNLVDATVLAQNLVDNPVRPAEAVLLLALDTVGVPPGLRTKILKRWEEADRPTLADFAPYTRHILLVDLFFNIAMGADLISRKRPSNKVDIASAPR